MARAGKTLIVHWGNKDANVVVYVQDTATCPSTSIFDAVVVTGLLQAVHECLYIVDGLCVGALSKLIRPWRPDSLSQKHTHSERSSGQYPSLDVRGGVFGHVSRLFFSARAQISITVAALPGRSWCRGRKRGGRT